MYKSSQLSLIQHVIAESLMNANISITADSCSALSLHILIAINRVETNNIINQEVSEAMRQSLEYKTDVYKRQSSISASRTWKSSMP